MAVFTVIGKANTNTYNVTLMSSLPILVDTVAVDAWGLLSAFSQEYVYVWDKNAKLAAFFQPWQSPFDDPVAFQSLLETLAQ